MEAESLRLQKGNVTPQLIKLRQIEAYKEAIRKWDGRLPRFAGGNVLPFIDLKNLDGKKLSPLLSLMGEEGVSEKSSFRASIARPGIQDFQAILDSGFRRNDGASGFCKRFL